VTRTHDATLPSLEDALALGLTRAEYELVCEKQGGRAPNLLELAMYSLLWSEHCAYKHSRKLLRTLPTEGEHVVMGPGENAGAVDVGGGLVCAFKVESHNHPSAVEPFQGAATGVGGILRDIFAVGARPIAVLDSLRFGESTSPRSRYLLDGAVAGIGHYGNSIGVPTVGGEVYFEAPYEHNCLVNVMALGLAARGRLVRSAASGPGNALVLFGASTGRDGIGGASVLASAELGEQGEGAQDKRPTVQVGDPFEEKKLMECSLELLDRGLLVALQDLGAAGLTSSAGEMASKGGVGLDIDVAKVPLREPDMEPFEVMVSESQERMLCVVEPANVEAVMELCRRWEVNGAAIGEVTAGGQLRVLRDGEVVGEMPVAALVDECPLYDLDPRKPDEPIYPPPPATAELSYASPPRELLLALLSCANLCSRRTLFEQYDSIVQSRTVRGPAQADAAVLALADASALAVSIDCNGRRVAADPYTGTVAAVLECAANLACVGAEPLGTTNNLNFANPEKPHVAWQMTESVRGLGDACRALRAPIVGGNVSLYNEGATGPIYPTPVIGMVGRLPDARRAGQLGFARPGDEIALVGPLRHSLAASELAKLLGEPLPDGLPEIDIAAVGAAQLAVREAVRAGALSSAHDVAEGGVAVALAECCLIGGLGAQVELPEGLWEPAPLPLPPDPASRDAVPPLLTAALFGEGSGSFLVSGEAAAVRALGERVAVLPIGRVGDDVLSIVEGGALAGTMLTLTLDELAEAYAALGELFS
jgi:phosphoribosylformylglycinamidine synthase subunit PurL